MNQSSSSFGSCYTIRWAYGVPADMTELPPAFEGGGIPVAAGPAPS